MVGWDALGRTRCKAMGRDALNWMGSSGWDGMFLVGQDAQRWEEMLSMGWDALGEIF